MNKVEEAVAFFENDYLCSQSIMAVYGPQFGLSKSDCLKISCPFGAGMGRLQKTCGAVSGALMVLGLHFCKNEKDTTERDELFSIVRKYCQEFESNHSSCECRDLLGADITTTEGREKAHEQDLFAIRCTNFVRSAAETLEQFLILEKDK